MYQPENPGVSMKPEWMMRELSRVSEEIENAAKAGADQWVAKATEDAGGGTIEGDVNATDWTGHPHAYPGSTCLEITTNDIVTFTNGKGYAYLWAGPKPVLLGTCPGAYVTTANDYEANSTIDHTILLGRDSPSQHPQSAITGLESRLTTDEGNLAAHIAAESNPHSTLHSDLTDVNTDNHHSMVHSHDGTSEEGGAIVHANTTQRDAVDSHPQGAITGLTDRLDADEQDLANHKTLEDVHHAKIHDHLSDAEGGIIDKVRWRNLWAQQQYYLNDMVRDAGWTMIANKDTEDRPSPQPTGDPQYVYQGTMSETSTQAKQLILGNRYTADRSGYLVGYRIYTKIGNAYEVYFVEDPLGAKIITSLISFTGAVDGWAEFSSNQVVVRDGAVFDLLIIVKEPDPTPTIWSGNWNYRTPNNVAVPLNGEITHANKALDVLSISTTDDDGGDRSAELAALTVGDLIEGGGVTWAIQLISPQAGYYDFTVSPATQGIDGVQQFDFHTVTATPITYGFDTDYWLTSGKPVQGLIGADIDYNNIVPDNTAYGGTDLRIQDATISPDWDVVATASDGVSGGDGGGASTLNLPSLQTSSAGLAQGDVYRDGDILKVVL